MKKRILVLFAYCFLVTQYAFMQTNNFKIGIIAIDGFVKIQNGVPVTTKYDANGNYTSVLGMLEEDGFNIVQDFLPWDQSKQYFKNFVQLIGSYGNSNDPFKYLTYDNLWFKPTGEDAGINEYGLDFLYGTNHDSYILNYDKAFTDVYNVLPYSNIIWGHAVAGESNFRSRFYKPGAYPTLGMWASDKENIDWTLCRIPADKLNLAFGYYKTQSSIPSQKLVNGQANHGRYIDANSTDPLDLVNPIKHSDYFNCVNHGDVQIESSFYHKQFKDYFTNDKNYLGKYLSIDYEKQYYTDIHSAIDVAEKEVPKDSAYIFTTRSNRNIDNYNQIWFQTYMSIIHGVKGVWYYSFGTLEDLSRPTDVTNNAILRNQSIANRFNSLTYFPYYYKYYLRFLANELRYLKNNNFLSDNPATILYTKTTNSDELGIVPAASTYLPSILTTGNPTLSPRKENARDLYALVPWQGSEKTNPANRINEFHGLRYTLRTNGTDIVMIITNPNPFTLTQVPLSFCKSFSITGVDVLFEWDNTTSYSGIGYKVTRDPMINLVNNTVGKYYVIPVDANNTIKLNFGPFDTHVLKLNLVNSGWADKIILNPSQVVQTYTDIEKQGNRIYYVRQDGIFSALDFNGTNWTDSWIYDPTWAKVKSGTSFDVGTSSQSPIYYVGASDSKLHKIYFDGIWKHTILSNSCGVNANSTSEVHTDENGRIYFADQNNKIRVIYNNETSCAIPVSNTVYPGTGFDVVPQLNGPVYYVDNATKDIYTIKNVSGTWTNARLTNCGMKARTDTEVHYGYGMGFFVRSDGTMCAFYPCGQSNWCCDYLNVNAPKVKEGTGFYVVNQWDSPIYYIGASGILAKIYYNNGWQYSNILIANNCTLGAKNYTDVTFDGQKLFYVAYSDGKLHMIAENTGLKSTSPVTSNSNHGQIKYFPDFYYPNDLDEIKYDIFVSPNPNKGVFNVHSESGVGQIEVMDLNGNIFYKKINIEESNFEVRLPGNLAGMYLIRFTSESGKVSIQKIVIE